MNGSVQIIDQLGTDGGLRQNQLNGGQGIARVAIKHRKEGQVFVGGLKAFIFYCHCASFCQPGQGLYRAMQELTDLSGRLAVFVGEEALGCVGQHELVALFHSFAAIRYLSPHRLTLDPPPAWIAMATKVLRPPIALDRVLSNKSPGSSSRRSWISCSRASP